MGWFVPSLSVLLLILGAGCTSPTRQPSAGPTATAVSAEGTSPSPSRALPTPASPTSKIDQPATSEEWALAKAFVSFALEPGDPSLRSRLFPRTAVRVGLGSELVKTLTPRQVGKPMQWHLQSRQSFRGYVGPFSAIQTLRRHTRSGGDLAFFVGSHLHCASPPRPVPRGMQGLRQISIQPDPGSMTSCLRWFTIDLFVTEDRRVVAVTLDLWEP